MFHRTQNKIIIIMSMVALMMMAGVYLLNKSDQGKIALLMSNQRKEKEALLEKIIELKSKSVGNFAYDYTYWDDMVDFVKSGDKDWARENIEISMPTFGVDVSWVYRTDLSVLYSMNRIGAGHLDRLPLSTDNLKKIVSKGPLCHFFMLIDPGLLEVFGASIHPTFDEKRETPAQGYFFVGCLWTKTYLEEMSTLSDTDLSLVSIENEQSDQRVENTKDFTITYTKALYGWDGTHIINLQSRSETLIAKTLKAQSNVQYSISIVFSIVLLVLLSFILFWLINKPLNLLSKGLADGNPDSIKGLAAQKNEFGSLAGLIRDFFNQKNQLVKEIEERKRAEDQLLIKDFAVESSVSAIALTDLQGKIIYVNNAYVKMWGYDDAKKLLGKHIYEFAESNELVDEALLALQSGREFVSEESGIRKDGTVFDIQMSANLVKSHNGSPVCIMASFIDITDRKRAENVLRESEQRLSSIYDTVGDIIYHLGVEAEEKYRFLSVNQAFCNTTGLRQEQIVGKMVNEVIPEPSLTMVLGKYRQAIDENRIIRWEETTDYPSGRVTGEVSIAPVFDDKGRCTHLVGSVHDITERKQVEEVLIQEQYLMNMLMDNVPDHIYFKDTDSRFIRTNKDHAKKFGLSDPSQAIGKTDFDFFTEEHARPAFEDEQTIIRTGNPIYNIEEKETWPDGRETWVITTKMPLRDKEGNIIGTFGVSHDITERKQAEETIQKERTMLRTLIDHLPVGVFVKDLEYRKIIANPIHLKEVSGHLKHLGMNSDMNILGKTDSEVFPKKLANQFFVDDQKVIRDGSLILNSEGSGFSEEGNPLVLLISKIPLRDHNGGIIGMVGVTTDITERKQAERVLRENEEKYRSIFENVQDVYYEADPDGTVLEVSPSVEILSKGQYHQADLIGKSFIDFYADIKDRDIIRSTLQKTGSLTDFEVRLKNRDGSYAYCSMSAKIVLDAQGRPGKIIGSLHDITERKWAEEALRKSEKKYRELINGMNETVWVIDFDGNLVDVNNTAVEVLGYSKEELLKIGLFGIDSSLKKRDIQALAKAMPSDKVQIFETTHTTKEGSKFPVEIYSSLVTYQGEKAILSIARDITERKLADKKLRESEERLSDIIYSVNDWVWEVDKNGRYTYSSEKGRELLGYASEEIIGKTPFDFMQPDEAERIKPEFSKIASNKAFIKDLVNWNVRKNGESICLLTNGVPILDENGNLKGYRGVDKDITERKRTEARIQNDLEEKKLLLKEIHHRVKNNLQIIISLIRIQARPIKDATALKAFKASINRIHSMALVHEHLYATENFKNIPFVNYIEKISSNLIKSSNISSRISLDLDIQNIELGIDTAIPCGLIVNELLTNSIKYAFPDQRDCRISISMHLVNNKNYEFIYRDNGIGMSVQPDAAQTGSFGIKLIHLLTEQINGKVVLTGDKGICCKITFLKDQKE